MRSISSLLIFILFFTFNSCKSFLHSPPPPLSLPLKKYRISQSFAPKNNVSHQGIDLAAPKGTNIYGSHSGKVIYAGDQFSRYGKIVIVEYSNKWSSLYAHLNKIQVKKGDRIKIQQVIGTVGNSGKSSGFHLHFELMYNKQPVNPLHYLKF